MGGGGGGVINTVYSLNFFDCMHVCKCFYWNQEWKQDKVKKRARAQYVWNKRHFQRVDAASTDYLLGEHPTQTRVEIEPLGIQQRSVSRLNQLVYNRDQFLD